MITSNIIIDRWQSTQIDSNPKKIQQIEFDGQLKNTDGRKADDMKSMFVLNVSKTKKNKTKTLSRDCNSLTKSENL